MPSLDYLMSLSPNEYQKAKEQWMAKNPEIGRRWKYLETLDDDAGRRFNFLTDILDYADLISDQRIDPQSKKGYCYEFRRAFFGYAREKGFDLRDYWAIMSSVKKARAWMLEKGFVLNEIASLDLDKVYDITTKQCLSHVKQ